MMRIQAENNILAIQLKNPLWIRSILELVADLLFSPHDHNDKSLGKNPEISLYVAVKEK